MWATIVIGMENERRIYAARHEVMLAKGRLAWAEYELEKFEYAGRGRSLKDFAEKVGWNLGLEWLQTLKPKHLSISYEQLEDAGNVTHNGLAIGIDCVQSVLQALGYMTVLDA